MAIGEVIAEVRAAQGMTQDELAQRVMVTRQAVSRWETGATTPGVDMCKLLAAALDVPVTRLLEAPPGPHCQSCGMPIPKDEQHGNEIDGTKSEDYCAWCYQDGAFIGPETLEEVIEHSAPYMSEGVHITEDEAISYMTAVLPQLRRWKEQ
ncbi:zinc ribbon domain-containing protein [Actinomyces ruminicola]|uniref:Transcriptional regulator, contains XRE-family HTH domain n=1 Tax=Actinomyces ruminicola TaxID=332524 RepID=A0A1G9SZS4_9ACTO|nr:zinc ribbon domain-containing protein [Actinomyces ruminicola]SDM40941.1 Transcriptional regulator, contains XRE-family HTH domain [Actinomyces ruminicola]